MLKKVNLEIFALCREIKSKTFLKLSLEKVILEDFSGDNFKKKYPEKVVHQSPTYPRPQLVMPVKV